MASNTEGKFTVSNSDRFLNACENIKDALGEKYPEQNFKGVGEALRFAEKNRHPVAMKRRKHFNTIRDVRNLMQHSLRSGNTAAVEPSDWLANEAEDLEKRFLRQPRISSVVEPDFYSCESEEKLHSVLLKMVEHDYSQAPVFRDGKFVDLLTTNSIARWVSGHLSSNGDLIMESATVDEVLSCLENFEMPAVVRLDAPISDVIEILSESGFQSGCVLITDTGNRSGQVKGIVTRFDLPRLQDRL